MRSIEGKMRGHRVDGKLCGNIKSEEARCAVCKDKIEPGLTVRAMIELPPDEEQPGIFITHPTCLKHWLARHSDVIDHRDDLGAIPDSVVRKFWVDLDKKKGWGGYIDDVLPLC